jgi:hypothetical protein
MAGPLTCCPERASWLGSARRESNVLSEGSESKGRILEGSVSEPNLRSWVVYILECNDDSYYIGFASDLQSRFEGPAPPTLPLGGP